MKKTLGLLGLAVAVVTLLTIALRSVSRRRSTACPTWLVPLLENPYVNTLAGAELLLDRAGVEPGMAVLDVGCGPGRITLPAARRIGPEGRVAAVDLQTAMLARLEQRRVALGIDNVEIFLGAAGEGSMPEGPFDRAFLVTVLGEIVEQDAALAEIYAALAPGGLLSVTEVLPDPHFQSRRRVRRLGEAAGFRLHSVHGTWWAFTLNLEKPRREKAG